MPAHPDVDLLALHALGEPALGETEQSHVAGCPRCSRTVDELSHTVSTVRGPAADQAVPVPVPAHVWQGIAAELDIDPAVRPSSVGPSKVRRTAEAATPAEPGKPAGATTSAGATSSGAHRDRTRRGRPALRLLAAAAAGLVVGAAGTVAVSELRGAADDPAPGTVVAAADLEEFGVGEGSGVTGSARLATVDPTGGAAGEDGQQVLQVWLDRLPDPGEDFLEAWLIDPGTGAMVSLGPVPTQEAGAATVELSVPRGLDVGTYTLVDVSAEPLDGDPTHSGASLARGSLGS